MFNLPDNYRCYVMFFAFLGLIACVMYGSTPDLMMDTDDGDYFAEAATAIKNPAHLFSSDRLPSAMGRPVIDLVFLIDYALWETNLTLYHYQVVVAHFLAAILLTVVFRRFGASVELSFLGALLFFINVAHFRAVHWIASIGYPLSLIFALLTVLAHQKFLISRQKRWMGSAALFLMAAVFTHPASAAVLFFCLYMTFQNAKNPLKIVRDTWHLLAITALCVGLSYFVYPDAAQTEAVDEPIHPMRVIQTFLWYLSRLITAPHWLFVDLRDHPFVYELVVGAAGYVILIWIYLRKSSPTSLFAVWIVVTLLPFFNAGPGFRWTPAGPSRHLYFPSVGSSFLIASGILCLGTYLVLRFGKRPAQIVTAGIVVGLIVLSVYNDWRAQAISFYASGRSYIARTEIEKGVGQLQRAIARDAKLTVPDTYIRLSQMLIAENQSPIDVLKIGCKIYPDNDELIFLEGFWETQQTDRPDFVESGIKKMQHAFQISPDQNVLRKNAAVVYSNLALYHCKNENIQKGADLYEQAMILNPQYFRAVYDLGRAYWQLEQFDKALEIFQKAIQIDPDAPEPYIGIARILMQKKRYDTARHILKILLDFSPQNADAYYWKAISFMVEKRPQEALQAYQEVLMRNPDHVDTWLDLAIMSETTNPAQAIQNFQEVLKRDPTNQQAREGITRLSR